MNNKKNLINRPVLCVGVDTNIIIIIVLFIVIVCGMNRLFKWEFSTTTRVVLLLYSLEFSLFESNAN